MLARFVAFRAGMRGTYLAKSLVATTEGSLSRLSRALSFMGMKKDAPLKPKKAPLSGYQIFLKESIIKIQETYSDEKPTDNFKRIASQWKNLDEFEKNKYREKSDGERENWMRDCAQYEAYLDSLSETERTRIKMKELLLKAGSKEKKQLSKQAVDDVVEKMPKRPGGPFQIFVNEEMKQGNLEGLKGPPLFQAASEKWKSITEQERGRYKTKRKQLQNKYLEDLEVWKKS